MTFRQILLILGIWLALTTPFALILARVLAYQNEDLPKPHHSVERNKTESVP